MMVAEEVANVIIFLDQRKHVCMQIFSKALLGKERKDFNDESKESLKDHRLNVTQIVSSVRDNNANKSDRERKKKTKHVLKSGSQKKNDYECKEDKNAECKMNREEFGKVQVL